MYMYASAVACTRIGCTGQLNCHHICHRYTSTLTAFNTAASACAYLTHVSSDRIRFSLFDLWDPHTSKLAPVDG